MKTIHELIIGNSANMDKIPTNSIDLVVTSPPYAMIKIWDQQFSQLNPKIGKVLANEDGAKAFELMHQELDKTWNECFRVLKEGGILCINIGDATRKIGKSFQLFTNHSRILNFCSSKFSILPPILWRKPNNSPNKFLGSGMLPPNAYITLEHEYILILRKGRLRMLKGVEKERRYQSAYFWEERNKWFSDIWFDLLGITQKLDNSGTRRRSAAFPFELAFRLINMYSIQGDSVLDPFIGTGTTMFAAMTAGRNSIGYEIDHTFLQIIQNQMKNIVSFSQDYIHNRLTKHREFINQRERNKKPPKYNSKYHRFKVITNQETKIRFPLLKKIATITDSKYEAAYTTPTD